MSEASDGAALVQQAQALLKGTQEAHDIARDNAEAARALLDAHCCAVDGCVKDLAQSDSASTVERWYREKVGALEADLSEHLARSSRASPKTEAKLSRNRGKLREAAVDASAMRARSQESLNACVLRRANLYQLAQGAVGGTIMALQSSLQYVPAASSAGPEARNGRNPFDGELDLSRVLSTTSEERRGPLKSPPPPKWTGPMFSKETSTGTGATNGDFEAQSLAQDLEEFGTPLRTPTGPRPPREAL